MATVTMLGPFSWIRPFGQNAMMPGEEHVWAFGNLPGVVFAVSAHPARDQDHQALAIERLSTAYARTGPPAVNFAVRNVSDTGVFSYRMFITATDF